MVLSYFEKWRNLFAIKGKARSKGWDDPLDEVYTPVPFLPPNPDAVIIACKRCGAEFGRVAYYSCANKDCPVFLKATL